MASKLITSDKRVVADFLNSIGDSLIVFDTETKGLYFCSDLLMLSIYVPDQNKAVAIYLHPFPNGMTVYELRMLLNECNFSKFSAVAHNGKYDITVFKAHELPVPKLVDDTILMVHLDNPDLEKNLEKRAKEDLRWNKKSFTDIIGKSWQTIKWEKDLYPQVNKKGEKVPPLITPENMGNYACEDVIATYELREFYLPRLQGTSHELYTKMELPLIKVLVDMYMRGVNIDTDVLKNLSSKLLADIEKLTQSIYEEANCVFNINSPQQKAKVLFDDLKLPCNNLTKTGNRSTDAETLEELAGMGYKIAEYLVKYSELNKLYTGYTEAIPKMIDYDGRLRCNFNATGTKTGRFSSDSPNLQNQPNNPEYPVRAAFIPTVGNHLIVADYSQIELRVMAHLSKDARFSKAFHDGEDIHQAVADALRITRKQAKVVNFGILYGMSAKSLGYSIGVSLKEAQGVVRNYEETYSGYYKWKIQTENYAKKHKEIRTLFGRRRRLPDITDSRFYYSALRKAVNTAVQGSAADIIKLAMIKLRGEFIRAGDDSHILLQVHDELVCEAPKRVSSERLQLMKDAMEGVVSLDVPIIADGKVCDKNWAQMKDDSYTYQIPDLSNADLSKQEKHDITLLMSILNK